MAIETRYVVVRTDKNNKEQDVMTFTDKRSADDYDKMLDMADAIFELLHDSSLSLEESQCEDLSVFLAKQREELLIALQAKKKVSTKKGTKKNKDEHQADLLTDDSDISPQSLSETILADVTGQTTNSETSSDDKLVDFVIEKDDAA